MGELDESLVVIITNCTPDESQDIATRLVVEGLVACVNVVPSVRSFYVWNGEFESTVEDTLIIKTPAHRADSAVDRLKELHSYSTPEVLVFKPDSVDPAYLAWARSATAAT